MTATSKGVWSSAFVLKNGTNEQNLKQVFPATFQVYGGVNAKKYNFKRKVEGRGEREMGSKALAEAEKIAKPPNRS